jgi:hypothetical protein
MCASPYLPPEGSALGRIEGIDAIGNERKRKGKTCTHCHRLFTDPDMSMMVF